MNIQTRIYKRDATYKKPMNMYKTMKIETYEQIITKIYKYIYSYVFCRQTWGREQWH